MDPLLAKRIWFLQMVQDGVVSWSSESVERRHRYEAIQDMLNDGRKRDSPGCYIFLVRAPLTFGHSQVVMRFTGKAKQHDEASRFKAAAEVIQKAVCAFHQVLESGAILKKSAFTNLAKLTHTRNEYIKTLVLRASADEDTKEYKVHLVPYFKSHAAICQARYTRVHPVNLEDRGGLLGWLGERETEIDRWQIPSETPWVYKLDEIANTDLRMIKLADLLAKAWPSQG